MAVFQFTAMDKNGASQKGSMEAENLKQARQQLRAQGLMPVALKPAQGSQTINEKTKKISASKEHIAKDQLTLITRQLATLLGGGIPLEKSLQLMAKQYEKSKVKNILLALASSIKEGNSFADSLAAFPRVFSTIYTTSIAAGEYAGCLDQTLIRLAAYGETSQHNRQKIQLALIYPAILTIASLAALTFLLGYVMPNIAKVFEDNNRQLPLITTLVMRASHAVSQYGIYTFGIIIIAGSLFFSMMKNEKYRYKIHKKLYNLPLIGKGESFLDIANFLRTFSILHKNGVPVVQAMQMSAKVVWNLYLREKFTLAAQQVTEGKNLSSSLEEIRYFPPTALYMIASGESGGKLDHMLEHAANDQEFWLQSKISTFIGIFEPLMILFMGCVVLIFVLAILLPILSYSQVMH